MIKSARVKFDKLKGETPKAFLIQIQGEEHWIPKSMCQRFTTNNKLGGHVELPAFIINRMFDIDINEMEILPDNIKATWVVEHHEPTKIDPLENNTINELKR
jgi:hypothetical protein